MISFVGHIWPFDENFWTHSNKEMCEFILPDILQFLCNFLDENGKKLIRISFAKRVEQDFVLKSKSGFQDFVLHPYKLLYYITTYSIIVIILGA